MPIALSPAVGRDLVDRLRRSGSVFPDEELAALLDGANHEDAVVARVERRITGEPIELIVGHALFAGLRILVAPGVFVPRARTEWLAERVCDLLPRGGRLLDLGCGTGAIAAFAMSRVPGLQVVAIDADPAAVRCARGNLPGALVVHGPTLADLPDDATGFDVIAANLPYVPTRELRLLPREARDHEPALALDGGSDGLDPLRRVAPGLASRLVPGAAFLVEVADQQVAIADAIVRDAGLVEVTVHPVEDYGSSVVEARRPGGTRE